MKTTGDARGMQRRAVNTTAVRRAIALVVTVFVVVVANAGRLRAFHEWYDDYLRISARPLAMGQTGVALAGDPSNVFYNPAGLAKVRKYTLLYNHSSRHMPKELTNGEVDQLDGDTQAICVPLGTYATAAAGFNFQGEMGYDYRKLNDDEFFKRERYAAVERVEAVAVGLSPWTQVGASRRSFTHNYESPKKRGFLEGLFGGTDKSWSREGDGHSFGIRQWIAPGMFYGYCESKVDFDYDSGESGRIKRKVNGLAFHPVGWLTLTRDAEKLNFIFKDKNKNYFNPIPSIDSNRVNIGLELNLASIAKLRIGEVGGTDIEPIKKSKSFENNSDLVVKMFFPDYKPSSTFGFELTLCNLKLNYTEAKDYLQRILGYIPELMRDIHIYGFTLAF